MQETPKPDLTTPEFFAKNDDLAKRYKGASTSARQNIILELYRLDLKLFQAWRVLGEDREDYQQEAALWLARSLETYKPDKGPFVNWLRGYIQNTFRHHLKHHKRRTEDLPDNDDLSDKEYETSHDPLFWRGVRRRVTPEQWDLIRLRFHENKTIAEIAKEKGTYAERIRAPLNLAIQAVKLASIANQRESVKQVSELDATGSQWMEPRKLAPYLGFTDADFKKVCNENVTPATCPFTIDPRDILRLSRKRLRIRFLETDKGLIYPRFIQRNKVVGRAGYL